MLNSYRFAWSLLAYGLLCIIIYPLYRHVFDFDAVGYFTVTKHLAAGEWYEAINGYWSPLHSWLALPLYKAGLNEFDAFKIISILAGAGILIMVNRLLKKYAVTSPAALFTAIPVVLCYVFCYQAADILLCLLLLIYAELVINPKKIFWCAVVACLAFFAKAYAFPFFILHWTIIHRKSWRNIRWGIGLFFLMALPWLAALFWKYRFVTFGYSGQLNIRWALFGHGINTRTLYAISPFPLHMHWEDPYSYPWNFTKIPYNEVVPGVIRLFFNNLWQLVQVIVLLSVFAPVVFYKKKDLLPILFPLGYLLVAVETRYLFVLSFLALVHGASLLTNQRKWIGVLFYTSFLIFPVKNLINSIHKGQSYFKLAAELPAAGKWVTNNFTAYQELARVAYLKHAQLYQFPREPKNDQEVLPACRQAGINYYFHYARSAQETVAFKQTQLYKTNQEIKTSEQNIIILKLQ